MYSSWVIVINKIYVKIKTINLDYELVCLTLAARQNSFANKRMCFPGGPCRDGALETSPELFAMLYPSQLEAVLRKRLIENLLIILNKKHNGKQWNPGYGRRHQQMPVSQR
jgi:hypothetical protein